MEGFIRQESFVVRWRSGPPTLPAASARSCGAAPFDPTLLLSLLFFWRRALVAWIVGVVVENNTVTVCLSFWRGLLDEVFDYGHPREAPGIGVLVHRWSGLLSFIALRRIVALSECRVLYRVFVIDRSMRFMYALRDLRRNGGLPSFRIRRDQIVTLLAEELDASVFPAKRFDAISPERCECSEGLDAFLLRIYKIQEYVKSAQPGMVANRFLWCTGVPLSMELIARLKSFYST